MDRVCPPPPKKNPPSQHVFTFAAALLPGVLPGVKRQLDCAGVVTTTYSLCQALSQRYMEQHGDLAGVRMQVSEDHCWLLTDSSGRRQSSVEVRVALAGGRLLWAASGDSIWCSELAASAAMPAWALLPLCRQPTVPLPSLSAWPTVIR